MKQNIKIGDKEIPMRASALSPVLYRSRFGNDLIIDSTKALNKDGTLKNAEIILQMGYIFASQCDENILPYEEWLDSFELMDFLTVSVDIIGLWAEGTVAKSEAKK